MNQPEKFITQFFDEATEALIKWDKYIHQQFSNSIHADTFYKEYYKGLGAWSVTERFIQFLIYIELCRNYKIVPEENSYKGLKRLDLAIYIDNNEEEHAEIGIELKWAGFTKAGRFNQSTFKNFVDDFKKIKAAPNMHKYIIQFGLTDVSINEDTLNKQVEDMDGRSIRSLKPQVLKINSFKTRTEDKETDFVLILWEIK